MNKTGQLLIALLTLFAPLLAAAQQDTPVRVVNVVELSGDGKIAGTNFHNGLMLAFKQINEAGGILGRQISVSTLDTATDLELAKLMVQQAADIGAYAIMGPVFSASVLASMPVIAEARTPSFVGAEAAEITEKGNPYIFRTSFTQATAMPKLARYIKTGVRASSVAIVWVNNPFGKGGRDQMVRALEAEGLRLAGEISTEPSQTDFTGVVEELSQFDADAAFIYLNEDESVLILQELLKQNFGKPILGETTLLSQKVIELAGTAADGILGHVGLTPEALVPGIRDFDTAFIRHHGYKSDHNGMKGYIGAYVLKAVTERIGSFDSQALADAMKGVDLRVEQHPRILLDVKYDQKGDLDRVSFIVRVVGGRHQFIATVPALGADAPASAVAK